VHRRCGTAFRRFTDGVLLNADGEHETEQPNLVFNRRLYKDVYRRGRVVLHGQRKIYKTTSAIDLAGINAIMSDGDIYSSLLSLPVLHYPFDGDYNDYSRERGFQRNHIQRGFIQSATHQTAFAGRDRCADRLYSQYIKLRRFQLTREWIDRVWYNTAQTSDNSTLFQLSNGNISVYLCCVSSLVQLIVKNAANAVIATIPTGISTDVLFTGTWLTAVTVEYGGTAGRVPFTRFTSTATTRNQRRRIPLRDYYTNYIGYNSSHRIYVGSVRQFQGLYVSLTLRNNGGYELRSTTKDSVNNKLVYYYVYLKRNNQRRELEELRLSSGYDGSVLMKVPRSSE
jgi:hypothetical protein